MLRNFKVHKRNNKGKCNVPLAEKVSIKSMLEKFGLLSVNQLAAQIKLREVWKSIYCEDYPIKLEPYNPALEDGSHSLRPKQNRVFSDSFRLNKAKANFNVDAARVWNSAPTSIRGALTIHEAKKAINAFVKTLPI